MVKYRPKRYFWLIDMIIQNGYTVGAEVGCAKGMTTHRLLKYCSELKRLYAVDLWAPVPDAIGGGGQYKDWNFASIRSQFDRLVKPYEKRLIVLQGISWLMADEVRESLDFVFIDADHECRSVVNDIRAWTPKVKSDGLISGHDFNHPGVMKALSELIPTWQDAGVDHVWYAKKEAVQL